MLPDFIEMWVLKALGCHFELAYLNQKIHHNVIQLMPETQYSGTFAEQCT